MKPFFLTAFALTAFAFNSILCRMALGEQEADAAGFTLVRLMAGAAALALISASIGKTRTVLKAGQWASAFFLFAYAIFFSFAYLGLTTGTGALILFGSVQMTMIAAASAKGERPGRLELFGIAAAFGGLVYLVFPGLTAPPLVSSLLMAAAGAAWGFYTLRGKGSTDPLADTTGNFIRTLPMMLLAAIPFVGSLHLSARGFALAVLSGAIASGVGYAVWYAALRYHTATRAAALQLSVPIIAAAGGVVLLAETADLRLVIAGVLTLGGIAVVIFGRSGYRKL
ncbi:MAG TPA: DMT family transporter [Pyrinomonadaceae bacterium]|nr:DMT family transporter [Pyrinomonadaceae bacterium]